MIKAQQKISPSKMEEGKVSNKKKGVERITSSLPKGDRVRRNLHNVESLHYIDGHYLSFSKSNLN